MAERIDPARVHELTAELVAIPTHDSATSGQEHLASLLAAQGFRCRLLAVTDEHPSLLAVRGGGGPFLCSHIDTHPPHAHPAPYSCGREADVLIGRGVLDAKGQIAALLAAVEAEPKAPATIVVTGDEETEGLGSELLELPESLRPTGGGVVLEPTRLEICVAQAGSLDLLLRATGTSAHAHAREGASAVDVLLEGVRGLGGLSFLSRNHPLLPAPRVLLTTVAGGEHPWRVPAHAQAEVSLTLLPGVDPEEARAELAALVSEPSASSGGATLEAEVVDTCEPIEVPGDLPVVRRLQGRLDGGARVSGMPSWTDAANLLTHHGIPCAVLGAGELGPAHSDYEWVRIGDLVRLAEVLARYISTD